MEGGDVMDPALQDAEIVVAAPTHTRRRFIVLVGRIALSTLMLAVLLRRMPHFRFENLLPDWNRDTAMFLALSLMFTLAGIVLSTLRWRAVLAALGQDASVRTLLSHTLAGLFVSNVLPTTIGGDVLRVARLSREDRE